MLCSILDSDHLCNNSYYLNDVNTKTISSVLNEFIDNPDIYIEIFYPIPLAELGKITQHLLSLIAFFVMESLFWKTFIYIFKRTTFVYHSCYSTSLFHTILFATWFPKNVLPCISLLLI